MSEFRKPVVVVSKCLGFEACRWNGQKLDDDFIHAMRDHVEFRPVCPECEVGLGCPRDPIRQVRPKGSTLIKLMQPATGRDITTEMNTYLDSFLDGMTDVDGFLLKYRSPTCGMYNVPVYQGVEKGPAVAKSGGFFGRAVRERFADYPAEDEGRLHNFIIREHYLTRLFVLTEFRHVRGENAPGALVDFHSRQKYLLMAYDEKTMREMGKLVSDLKAADFGEILWQYETMLRKALLNPMRFTAAINVLMHGLGYFKKELQPAEKAFFLDSLEDYRQARVPLSVLQRMLQSWALRYEQDYLLSQSFFAPYPDALVRITDSGKGRKLT